MAPNLQGLNVVLPAQNNLDSQDLIPNHAYPDIAAQLALWTNLSFDSEESPVLTSAESSYSRKASDDEDERVKSHEQAKNAAIHDGHVNVVTGTAVPNARNNIPAPQQSLQQHQFDITTLLSSLGGGDYSQFVNQQQPPPSISPSLAQLLLFNAQNHSTPQPAASKTSEYDREQTEEPSPPAKRARTRRSSVSVSEAASPFDASGGPLSPAEDKRRRNTAASARFRMKKKEREAALEGKAKELEVRVNELERECEGLRRENGWLKGLVVGVTGAAQGSTITSTSGKRLREDDA